MPEIVELTEDGSMALLRGGVFGRIAFVTAAGLQVIPINYSVVNDAIVMRVAGDSALAAAAGQGEAVFEVDQVEYDDHRGWSVIARGVTEIVTEPDELAEIARAWAPRPWATGARPVHVRMAWTVVTGRQLGDGWDPRMSMPVRRVITARELR